MPPRRRRPAPRPPRRLSAALPPGRPEAARARASDAAADLADLVDERTVDVREEIDEDDFFTDEHGASTIVTRYDLERAVPQAKKSHFREEERYWVNEPYAFVILFHSTKENEKKYYVIEPHVDRIEADLVEFLEGKLRTAIKYSDDGGKPSRAAGSTSTAAQSAVVGAAPGSTPS